ncbi:MAG: hypothetical protein WC776_05285 [Patescibacteria group bacterium]|jgi:hypothetical protein
MSKKVDIKSTKYQEAVRLKYSGDSYSFISKKIKIPVSTIEKWFAFGGLLKGEYEKYRDEQNTIRHENGLVIFKKNIEIASSMIVALMGSENDNVKLNASKEIVYREYGKPKETVEHRGLFESGLNYEQILRKARDRPPDG